MFFSRPKFRRGSILKVIESSEFILIKNRRKVRPNGEQRRQWVYDGALLEAKSDGSIGYRTGISCVLETSLEPVFGLG
jgi:hypothetical protein